MELAEFRKKGLGKRDRMLAEQIVRRGVQGASVLEVGGGIGGIQIELLKAGAAHTTDVDIAQGYVQAARELAQSLGYGERAEHRALDFAQEAGAVEPADVVVLNRVICCYPDMPALVFPRDAGWIRLGLQAANAALWLARRDARFFAHRHQDILAIVRRDGLRPVHDQFSGVWRTMLFERA